MKYQVQSASANSTNRDDEELDSDIWETVASGETMGEVMEYLLRSANDEEFDTANSWLRLVTNETEVKTF